MNELNYIDDAIEISESALATLRVTQRGVCRRARPLRALLYDLLNRLLTTIHHLIASFQEFVSISATELRHAIPIVISWHL